MKPTRFTTILSTLVALMLLGPAATSAATEDSVKTTWQEIYQLLQGEEDASQPKLLKDGQAVVNIVSGLIRFEVDHLPILAGPSDVEFGTQDAASTMVKGTLVCHLSAGAQATLVDTPLVPVTDAGHATFTGYVSLPLECTSAPHDVAFFIRTTKGGAQGL